LIPPAIIAELRRSRTPDTVKQWAAAPPAWLEVQAPTMPRVKQRLGSGEADAIALAEEVHADLLLLDDRDGVAVARRMGLSVTGTLGVLDLAARQQLVDLGQAITALRQTTFRGSEEIEQELLKQDQLRKSSTSE